MTSNSVSKRYVTAGIPAITCRPLPLPSFAPSMIPGKSSSCIFAPLYLITPGTVVRVVNSYDATSEYTPARLVRRVDFPTDGNPVEKKNQRIPSFKVAL